MWGAISAVHFPLPITSVLVGSGEAQFGRLLILRTFPVDGFHVERQIHGGCDLLWSGACFTSAICWLDPWKVSMDIFIPLRPGDQLVIGEAKVLHFRHLAYIFTPLSQRNTVGRLFDHGGLRCMLRACTTIRREEVTSSCGYVIPFADLIFIEDHPALCCIGHTSKARRRTHSDTPHSSHSTRRPRAQARSSVPWSSCRHPWAFALDRRPLHGAVIQPSCWSPGRRGVHRSWWSASYSHAPCKDWQVANRNLGIGRSKLKGSMQAWVLTQTLPEKRLAQAVCMCRHYLNYTSYLIIFTPRLPPLLSYSRFILDKLQFLSTAGLPIWHDNEWSDGKGYWLKAKRWLFKHACPWGRLIHRSAFVVFFLSRLQTNSDFISPLLKYLKQRFGVTT